MGQRARATGPDTSSITELPEVLQFMRLLWAIVHQLQKTSKRMKADLGVTGPQRLVLRVLGLCPGASAGTLAHILHVHPSTLTGVLQRLAARGLLRRSSAAADRRRSVLSLTPRGERVNAAEAGTVEAAIASALDAIGPREAAATQRTLAAIAGSLEASLGAGRRPARRRAPGRARRRGR